MPTQAEIDALQERTKSVSGTIGKIDLGAGVYDLNTRPDDNKQGTDERIQNDGIDSIQDQTSSAVNGYSGELFDVVEDDNTAGQRYFLTSPA